MLAAAVVWWRRGRPPLDRRLLAAGAAGLVVFVVVAGLIARPYFQVADENPEAKRPPSTVAAFSGPATVFLTAPDENFVWGERDRARSATTSRTSRRRRSSPAC